MTTNAMKSNSAETDEMERLRGEFVPMKNPKTISHETGQDGELIGRDPRNMSVDDLTACGHKAMSPLKALRLRCLDCCGDSSAEVRMCVAVDCPAWPFRMGKNPWRAKRELSDEHLASLAAGRKKSSLLGTANEDEGAEGSSTPGNDPA